MNNGHANEEIQLRRELKVWEGKVKGALDQVLEVEVWQSIQVTIA